MGINNIVDQKIRVKYLRSYYELKDLGRITMDENIEFFNPSKELEIQKNKQNNFRGQNTKKRN